MRDRICLCGGKCLYVHYREQKRVIILYGSLPILWGRVSHFSQPRWKPARLVDPVSAPTRGWGLRYDQDVSARIQAVVFMLTQQALLNTEPPLQPLRYLLISDGHLDSSFLYLVFKCWCVCLSLHVCVHVPLLVEAQKTTLDVAFQKNHLCFLEMQLSVACHSLRCYRLAREFQRSTCLSSRCWDYCLCHHARQGVYFLRFIF